MRYPKPWLAVVLGYMQPFGMMYLVRPGWAAFYFFGTLALALALFLVGLAPWAGILGFVVNIVAAVHCYRIAKRMSVAEDFRRPAYSRWYGMLGLWVATVCVVLLFRAFLFEPFHIPAGSMMPNLKIGQYILVKKWGYGHYGAFGITPFRAPISAPLDRGDVVVFDYPVDPSLQYIKRIVGLPGDVISIRGNGLSINGKDVKRERMIDVAPGIEQHLESSDGNRYAVLLTSESHSAVRPFIRFPFIENCEYSTEGLRCLVPPGNYFVLGDNRDNSQDSRYWGFVPAENIVGKLAYVTP
jgi:signal peptidase I